MIAPTTIDNFSEETQTDGMNWLQEYFNVHMNNGWSGLLEIIAIRHGVDYDLVGDMKQETMIRLGRDNQVNENLKHYVLKIFTNCCRLHSRRDGNRVDKHGYGATPPHDYVIEQKSPLDEAINKEQITILQAAFNRIGNEYRKILTLHYYDRLPYSAIGQMLGIPQGTAQSRVYRAIRLLKRMFDDEVGTRISQTRVSSPSYL